MKIKIILIPIILLAFQANAQKKAIVKLPFDSTTQKYTYKKIVEVPDKDTSYFYKTSKNWCLKKYPDQKFLNDKEYQHLSETGNFLINVVLGSKRNGIHEVIKISFRTEFSFKNGKCKIEITDIMVAGTEGNTAPYPSEKLVMEKSGMGHKAYNRWVNDILKNIDKNITAILSEIEDALKGIAKDKSDW